MPQLYSNEGSALLQSDLNPSDTTTTLAPGEGDRFPLPDASDPDSFAIVTIEDNNGFYEIAKLTERSGDILTLERAQEDTSALGFTALVSRIETRLTSGTLSNFVQQSQKFELRGTDVEVDNIKLWHNTDPSTYQYFRLQYTDVFTAPTMLLTPPAGVNGTSVAIGVINDEGGQDTLRLGPVNDSVLSGKGGGVHACPEPAHDRQYSVRGDRHSDMGVERGGCGQADLENLRRQGVVFVRGA